MTGLKGRVIVAIIWLFLVAAAPAAISGSSGLDADCRLSDGYERQRSSNNPRFNPNSTVGIINALCDVKLRIVGCLFSPTEISIACDANGDGVAELIIPLKNVTLVNGLLVEATLPALEPQLPGTAFPLACCGGIASITLTRRVGSGDDNAFGPFVESQTCPIDLGKEPVVISATPRDEIAAWTEPTEPLCFLLDERDRTSLGLSVERQSGNIIQSNAVVILEHELDRRSSIWS